MSPISTGRHLPVSTTELHQLIQQALLDLKHARDINYAAGAARSERRLNALLDQLAKRSPVNIARHETSVRTAS